MKPTSRIKPVILASAAMFVFALAMAPRLFDGGMVYKTEAARASEDSPITSHASSAGDHDFDGNSDASGHDGSEGELGGDHDGDGGSDGGGDD